MSESELTLVVTALFWLTANLVVLVRLRRRKGPVAIAPRRYSNRESSAEGP